MIDKKVSIFMQKSPKANMYVIDPVSFHSRGKNLIQTFVLILTFCSQNHTFGFSSLLNYSTQNKDLPW